jgi:hypothetical protein
MNLSDSEKQRGAVLIELAIAAPLLMWLFLISTEYVRALEAQQAMAVISREAANATFRDCVELDDRNECLDYVYNQVAGSAQVALPGAELLISVYILHHDPVTKVDTVTVETRPPGGVASGKLSQFSVGDYSTTHLGFMQAQQKIAVAEVFFKFTPFFKDTPISTDFYDAAIY